MTARSRFERTCRAQLFALVLERQSIAGLDLDGGDAFGQQCIEPRQRAGDELGLAGGARGAHRGKDAAAGARDGFVAHAVQPLFEFGGAIAGVDEVSVAVDQSGRDPAALAVDDFRAHRAPGRRADGPA